MKKYFDQNKDVERLKSLWKEITKVIIFLYDFLVEIN